MTKKPLSLMILAAVILFAAGIVTGLGLAPKKAAPVSAPLAATASETKLLTVSVMIDTGADILGFSNLGIEDSDTVWSVLERLSAKETSLAVESEQYQDLGRLIKAIKGFQNGTDNRYWQYWVNNQYASLAADKQAVKAGDVIMWKFTGSEFKEIN